MNETKPDLLSQIDFYKDRAKNEGSHSKLGKFYRKKAKEKRQQILELIPQILEASDIVDFSIDDILDIDPDLSKIDVAYDILESGLLLSDPDWSLEDIIETGAVMYGSNFGLGSG